jgi:hypothetical protein
MLVNCSPRKEHRVNLIHYTYMSRHQIAGRNRNVKAASKAFENVKHLSIWQ